ncbi:MAG: hypothetical protein BGO10_01875 [Chlamydia sp. 32-24]|nr:MAG: hypothetical protein BGO10_01875 [Chlamydia sp. 32-24]
MPFIIRPIFWDDLDDYEEIAQMATLGMTNLPKKRSLLEMKIEQSIESFKKNVQKPSDEHYIFALEDTSLKKMIGTASLIAKIGSDNPRNYYRIEAVADKLVALEAERTMEVLRPVQIKNGSSELCALYINDKYRGSGLGKLLSLSRFLFIKAFKERFDNYISADLRGVVKDKNSVFWEGIGRNFLDFDFEELMIRFEGNHNYSLDVLPQWPIYTCMLPKTVKSIMGKVHPDTQPALKMLINEGFAFSNEIDVFDGGPRIIALKENIRTVDTSIKATVKAIHSKNSDVKNYIMGNTKINFRSCFGKIEHVDEKNVAISKQEAENLQVKPGDEITYIALN